jgi:peptide/nickel transport system ATP-binding protein
VTVQAQILKLIRDLQRELGMAVLLITHDLGVVANMAEEVVVAHHGRVVESGTLADVFTRTGAPLPQGAAERGAAFRDEAGRAAEADPRDQDARRRVRLARPRQGGERSARCWRCAG